MTGETHEHTMTPGQLLTAAREARGLSQVDIAKQTRLSLQVIGDIERDEYAQIGVRTFVRGYLCSFARLVGVSEKQILESFDASGLMLDVAYTVLPSIEGAPVLNVTRQRRRSSRGRYSRWVIIGASVVLVVAGIVWLQSQKSLVLKPIASDAKTQTSSIALSQPTPVIVKKKAVVDSKKHHAQENSQSNGFIIKPQAKLPTTYKITPAT